MGDCNCHSKNVGPTLEGLGHIALYTKDIKKTVDFYTNILGFQKIEEFALPRNGGTMRIVFLMCVDIIMEVIQQPEGVATSEGDGVFQHIALQVTQLEKLVPLLKDEGIVFETEDYIPIPEMFNGSKCIFFRGPSGERLELFEYGDMGGCEGDCCDCEHGDCCGCGGDEFDDDCDCDDCDCDCDDCDCDCDNCDCDCDCDDCDCDDCDCDDDDDDDDCCCCCHHKD